MTRNLRIEQIFYFVIKALGLENIKCDISLLIQVKAVFMNRIASALRTNPIVICFGVKVDITEDEAPYPKLKYIILLNGRHHVEVLRNNAIIELLIKIRSHRIVLSLFLLIITLISRVIINSINRQQVFNHEDIDPVILVG